MKKEIKALWLCLKVTLVICILALIFKDISLATLKDAAIIGGYFTLFYFYWTFCVRDTQG
jgi:hypothetical protein